MRYSPVLPRLDVPELIPIAEFLEQSLPFNELPLQDLYATVGKIVVQYHCRGEVFNRDTQETGLRVAHILFNPGVLDYMGIVTGFGIIKVRPPDRIVNSTLESAGLSDARDKYGIAVLAIRRGREHILTPSKDEIIKPGDQLIVAGRDEYLGRFQDIARDVEASA